MKNLGLLAASASAARATCARSSRPTQLIR